MIMSTELTHKLNRNPAGRNFRLTKEQNHLLLDMIVFFKLPHNLMKGFHINIGTIPNSNEVHIIRLTGEQISDHLKRVLDVGLYGDGGQEILNGMRKCYMDYMLLYKS